MKRAIFAILMMATIFVAQGYSQMVAEQITKDNASKRLFSGSKATGGVGDWYLSNGVVEAVIDNAAFAPDLAALGTNRPLQNIIAPTGGTLIDLATVGKNNDQFNQMFQVGNIDPNNAFFYLGITSNVTPQLATVTAQGILLFGDVSTLSAPTLQAQTVYSLAPGDKFLTITTTVINGNKTDVSVFNITDAIPLVGRNLLPFVPFPGRGFNNPKLVVTSPEGVAAALGIYPFVALPGNVGPANGITDPTTGAVSGEVAYGLVPVSIAIDPDGPAGPMNPIVTQLSALLGANSDLVSASGNPFDPSKSPKLPAGGSITYTRRVLLGDRNDVASVSDIIYGNLGKALSVPIIPVTGDIDAEDTPDVEANIIIEGTLAPIFGDKSLPLTQVRTDKTGKFSVMLPPGDYTFSIVSPNRNDVTGVKVTVGTGPTTASTPKLSSTGLVSFTVSEKSNPVPAKLTFIGLDGTPNPDFGRFLSASILDPKTGSIVADLQASTYTGAPTSNNVFTVDGVGRQIIKPGKYQVIASRGFEYTIGMKTITITAGQETKVDFAIERVVDTTGFVSADFHIHSGKSFDSSAPIEDRVRTYVADGVEVMVATEHNYIVDYGPVVQKLGLSRFVKTVVGDELTTSLPNPLFLQAFGHHIAFPLTVDPIGPRKGAPFTEYVPSAVFYDRVRAMNPGIQKVIQLNHPRAGVSGLTLIGLFNTLNFSPTKPVPFSLFVTSPLTNKTRNIDFDSMELYNGNNIGEYQQVRTDWFGLLNQGFFKTATAVADSHRIVVENAGYPRSYIGSPTDEPSSVTDDMVTKSVLAGNVLGTSGPFIRFSIDGKGMGSLISKKTGKVTASITVTAPAWVPVDEVRIYANGKLVKSFDATTNPKVVAAPGDPTSNQGVERFKATVKLKPLSGKDTYFTVEAGTKLPKAIDTDGDGVIDTGDTNGDGKIDSKDSGFVQPQSPVIYQMIAPGFVPLAFTNPIFIDRNGNGKFDAPGIDASIVPTTIVERKGEVVQRRDEEDYFPWYQMHAGPEEMNKFFELLNDAERKLAQPGKTEEK